jgi:hypothetical protein
MLMPCQRAEIQVELLRNLLNCSVVHPMSFIRTFLSIAHLEHSYDQVDNWSKSMDPIILLRAAVVLFKSVGNEELLAETRAVVQRIIAGCK